MKDTHSSAESSDSEDEEYIEGEDDKESEEEELEEMRATNTTTDNIEQLENGTTNITIPEEPESAPVPLKKHSAPPKSCSFDQLLENKKMVTSNSFDSLSEKVSRDMAGKEGRPKMKKESAFNFDMTFKKAPKEKTENRKISDPGPPTEFEKSEPSRLHRRGAFKGSRNTRSNTSTSSAPPDLQPRPQSPQSPGQDRWANRRYVFLFLFFYAGKKTDHWEQ